MYSAIATFIFHLHSSGGPYIHVLVYTLTRWKADLDKTQFIKPRGQTSSS